MDYKELLEDIEKYTVEVMEIEAVWDFDFKDKEFPGNEYELSDKKKYKKEELILGIDNIREYKLKNIIN